MWVKDSLVASGLKVGVFCPGGYRFPATGVGLQDTGERVNELGGDWIVKSSTDREELLFGTDYLINTIEASRVKYIGNSTGPGEIMKALRTIPSRLEILEGAERLCPNALVLNHTNPMHVILLAIAKTSDMQVVASAIPSGILQDS